MTLFEKLTQSKEVLAQYLLDYYDNPLIDTLGMCNLCKKYGDKQCNNDDCLQAIIKGLDFESITKDKETLCQYLMDASDNPMDCEDEDVCESCVRFITDESLDCTDERCEAALLKALDSEVDK